MLSKKLNHQLDVFKHKIGNLPNLCQFITRRKYIFVSYKFCIFVYLHIYFFTKHFQQNSLYRTTASLNFTHCYLAKQFLRECFILFDTIFYPYLKVKTIFCLANLKSTTRTQCSIFVFDHHINRSDKRLDNSSIYVIKDLQYDIVDIRLYRK